MKKIIISFGIAFMLLSFSVQGFAHCTKNYWNDGQCVEIWCFNVDANTPIECLCGSGPWYDCYSGPGQ